MAIVELLYKVLSITMKKRNLKTRIKGEKGYCTGVDTRRDAIEAHRHWATDSGAGHWRDETDASGLEKCSGPWLAKV